MNYQPVTKVYINLDALKNNINFVRKKFPNSKIIVPVKANAYGHDATIISKACEKLRVDYLAIARLKEGLKLRSNGIKLPILSLGVETFDDNIALAISNEIELSISDISNLLTIDSIAKQNNQIAKIHLKVDTGMTRLGCNIDEILEIAKIIKSSQNLKFVSFYSHLARSEEDRIFTQSQIDKFLEIRDKMEKLNLEPEFYHLYNSGAIIDQYETNLDLAIRPGIMVYGYSPYANGDKNLIPVMTLATNVIAIRNVKKGVGVSYNHKYITTKPTFLATIPLGYGDGIRRDLSNKLIVTINGKNYPQRGTITMDLMMIEVDEDVKVGDEVIVFGRDEECINSAETLAKLSNTISYEITTAISDRVDKIVIGTF